MAWMDLLALLVQLFPDALGPYTLDDVTAALQEAYGPRRINYARVRYTWAQLYDQPETMHYVRPLDDKRRPMQFDAGAARNIAKGAVKGKLPTALQKIAAESSQIRHQLHKPEEPVAPARRADDDTTQAYSAVPRTTPNLNRDLASLTVMRRDKRSRRRAAAKPSDRPASR